MAQTQKAKLSNLMIWIGVLAWLPYIVLRLLRIPLSAIPFLIVHVIFVLGGVLLRRQTEAGSPPPSIRTRRLKTFSTILLVLGVSMWGVYLLVKTFSGSAPEITPFLTAHLVGVLSGAAIKLYLFFSKS